MAQQDKAPSDARRVAQLADSLSQAADALHARVMDALRSVPGTAPAALALSPDQARILFEHEVALRQQANALYMDAAGHAVAGLDAAQRSILALADGAIGNLARIDAVRDLIDIGADLLALAGALAAGQPEQIVSAARKIEAGLGKPPQPGA